MVPSGKLTSLYGKSPFSMGNSTNQRVIFHRHAATPRDRHRWRRGLEPPRNVRRLSSNFVVEAFPTRQAARPAAEPMERQVTTEEVKDEER